MEIADPVDQDIARAAPPNVKGSSFYTALRILPREQRAAMFEVYAFCRAVDDIADGDADQPTRRAQLDEWRHRLDAIFNRSAALEDLALAETVLRYGLAREDFDAVIAGMKSDIDAPWVAPSFDQLDLYCDRVASAVGRLSTPIFGMEKSAGIALSHHLGRALQFTNILRDVDEDAAIGRLYLAREDLLAAGYEGALTPADVLASSALEPACRALAARAFEHYERAAEVMDRSPRRTVRAPRIMGEVYREILEKTLARGFATPRIRVSLSRARIAWCAARYAFL